MHAAYDAWTATVRSIIAVLFFTCALLAATEGQEIAGVLLGFASGVFSRQVIIDVLWLRERSRR